MKPGGTDSQSAQTKRQLCEEDGISVSYEFFPPKTEKMAETLWSSIHRLAPLRPQFVSVTYGAGGSTRERTHATVERLVRETMVVPAAHLTCVSATKEEVNEVAKSYWHAGVRHVVALRGDPPDGPGTKYVPYPGGYENARALTEGLKKIANFEISVAAYPEMHPESASVEADIANLKAKVDAGADRAITQFFFDNDVYLRYLDKVRDAGIDIPITPGIVPIINFKQVTSFAKRSGASVPDWLTHRFAGLEEDPETARLVAAAVAAEQVMDLVERGIKEFHFYTLNRANLVYAICHMLGLRPEQETGIKEAV